MEYVERTVGAHGVFSATVNSYNAALSLSKARLLNYVLEIYAGDRQYEKPYAWRSTRKADLALIVASCMRDSI